MFQMCSFELILNWVLFNMIKYIKLDSVTTSISDSFYYLSISCFAIFRLMHASFQELSTG